jgi:hypothetical protein
MVICNICNIECNHYKGLSAHIKNVHKLTSLEYHKECYGIGLCDFCNSPTKFKNLNIGFLKSCSVKCSYTKRNTNEDFRKSNSEKQIGKPKKKHSDETKKLISENSKINWIKHRDKYLEIFRSEEHRNKQSENRVKQTNIKTITTINGIRCDSNDEALFIKKCIKENLKVERFSYNGNPSIKIDNKTVLPDFLLDNLIIEVKDFHIWFRNELFSGLNKYKSILKWSNEHEFIYMFWFKDYGYIHVSDLLDIKSEEDLKNFKKKNKNSFSSYNGEI